MKNIVSLFLTLSILISTGYSCGEGYITQTRKGEYFERLFHKKEYVNEIHTGEVSDYKWNESDEYTSDYAVTIYKEPGRDFKILNIADIHFSDFGYRVFYSVFTESVLRRLVEDVKPDLILLSGDNVCDDGTYYSVRHLTDLMESFGIFWAPVFGNHDDEGNCDLNYLADIMMKGPHCLMKKGDPDMGVGNYVINIAEGERIVDTLVMADSHHSEINELQQKWYKWVCEGTEKISGGSAEVSLVEHIPFAEYQFAYDEYCRLGKWADGSGGSGKKHEKICCPRDEKGNAESHGAFDILKSTGNTKYIFCGHDHRNDFSVMYEGIRLTYCMKIGKSSGYQPGFNGGTVITLDSDGIKTVTHKVSRASGFKDIETVNCR